MKFTPLFQMLLMISRTLYHFLCFFSLSTLSRKTFLSLFLHLETYPTLQLPWIDIFAYSTSLVKYITHMYFCSPLYQPCSNSNHTVAKVKICWMSFTVYSLTHSIVFPSYTVLKNEVTVDPH